MRRRAELKPDIDCRGEDYGWRWEGNWKEVEADGVAGERCRPLSLQIKRQTCWGPMSQA